MLSAMGRLSRRSFQRKSLDMLPPKNPSPRPEAGEGENTSSPLLLNHFQPIRVNLFRRWEQVSPDACRGRQIG